MDLYSKYIEELHNDSKQKPTTDKIPILYKKTNHFAEFMSKLDGSESEQYLSKQPYTDEQFEEDLAKWFEESEKHKYPIDPKNKLIFDNVKKFLDKMETNKESENIITDSKIEIGKQQHEYKEFARIWCEITKNDNDK